MDTLPIAVAPHLEPQLEAIRQQHKLPMDTPKGELVRLLILDQMERKQAIVVEKLPQMATPAPHVPINKGRKLSPERAAQVRKNLKIGGTHRRGCKHSEESKARVSAAKKGIKLSPEHAAKLRKHLKVGGNHNKGRVHTAESRANMSAAHKASARSKAQALINVQKAKAQFLKNHPKKKKPITEE